MVGHKPLYRATTGRARAWFLATMAVLTAACAGSSQIIAPTPTRTTAPPTAPSDPVPAPSGSGWTVTIRTVVNEGPDFCLWLPTVGSVFQGVYQLVENGDTVVFVPPDPVDWESYTAIRSGQAFTATNPPVAYGPGMCAHYVYAATLSGTFSADNKSFTATETWSFALDSGQVKAIIFSWSGSESATETVRRS